MKLELLMESLILCLFLWEGAPLNLVGLNVEYTRMAWHCGPNLESVGLEAFLSSLASSCWCFLLHPKLLSVASVALNFRKKELSKMPHSSRIDLLGYTCVPRGLKLEVLLVLFTHADLDFSRVFAMLPLPRHVLCLKGQLHSHHNHIILAMSQVATNDS